MNGIFVSHSTQNMELVEQVVEFLQVGMGIAREQIFCTSLNGTLHTGEDFIAAIKEKMKTCNMVIAIITQEYLRSKFCMIELGAAWLRAKYFCPLLAGSVDYKHFEGTPLKGIQLRKLDHEKDLCAIFDEMVNQNIISVVDSMRFHKKLQEFLPYVVNYTESELSLIYPDKDGYYQSKVTEMRLNVPNKFRCYKIEGRVVLPNIEKEQTKDETHWIFFKANVYEDLKVDDLIRFRIHKTERRSFPDLGWVRNIYPSKLCVIGG